MKRNPPKISQAEWRVMEILWNSSPLSFSEINNALSDSSSWNSKTVGTLIRRLVEKRAIRSENQGRINLYHAEVTEDQMLAIETTSFLERYFSGSMSRMVTHLLQNGELPREEIDAMKNLLERMDQG